MISTCKTLLVTCVALIGTVVSDDRILFDEMDANFDGKISLDELYTHFDHGHTDPRALGSRTKHMWGEEAIPHEHVAEIFDLEDQDLDGYISWEEWEMDIHAPRASRPDDPLLERRRNVFDEVDTNHDGKITKVELLAHFDNDAFRDHLPDTNGDVHQDEHLERAIGDVFDREDRDGSGYLSPDELKFMGHDEI